MTTSDEHQARLQHLITRESVTRAIHNEASDELTRHHRQILAKTSAARRRQDENQRKSNRRRTAK
ncbi:hypothetical protein LCGC14_1541800 [marine sediment metagenome]|uniref:Uncharacterized protein n=1 Tax=marine sediment metagenome TaxID=412755 RepID=A0A0F9LTM5_9ZZZZ